MSNKILRKMAKRKRNIKKIKKTRKIPTIVLGRRDSKLVKGILEVREEVDILNPNIPLSKFLKKYEGKEIFLIVSKDNSYNIEIRGGVHPQNYVSIGEGIKDYQRRKLK